MAGVWRVVHKPRVAVRAEPSTTGAIAGVQKFGDVCHAIEAKGPWLRVNGEHKGWILSDGSSVGLGQLLERLDDKPLRLHAISPVDRSRLCDFELPGTALVGEAREQVAKAGLKLKCILPCKGSMSVIPESMTLYNAGFRDGDEFSFVYIDVEDSPKEDAAPSSFAEDLDPDTTAILKRLRQDGASWCDVRAAVEAGRQKEAIEALLHALGRGSLTAAKMLFTWGMSPGLAEVKVDGDGPQLVLIFGWGGSNVAQLEEVRNWWRQRGCATLVTTRCIEDVDAQLEVVIAALSNAERVLIHAFSNNGMYLVRDLLARWRGNVAGIVLDSAPDNSLSETLLRQVANGCVRALCALHRVPVDDAADRCLAEFGPLDEVREGDKLSWVEPPSEPNGSLVFGPDGRVRGLLLAGPERLDRESFETVAAGLIGRPWEKEDVAEGTRKKLKVLTIIFPDLADVLLAHEAVPALFLYSGGDTLVKAKQVEDYIARHTREGQAKSVRFERSQHVRHFSQHRERYARELSVFAESVGFSDEAKELLTPRSAQLTGGDAASGQTPWMRRLGKANPSAKARLICFSWTGNRGGQGSAHNFLKPASPRWSEYLADFEPYEINWTGRGARMKEPRIEDCAKLTEELSGALAQALSGGKPCVFLGFSFGAIIAFECARRLQRQSLGPMCLVVASAEGPQWPGRAQMGLAGMSDATFEQMLADKGGTDFILKGDPAMKAMFLPVIKSDVTLEETYRYDQARPGPLLCPVLAFCGEAEGRDKLKSFVSREDSSLWLATTACAEASAVSELPSDWYIFQDEVGCERVAQTISEFCEPRLT